MTHYPRFEERGEATSAGRILLDWHQNLKESERGDRAALRRVADIEEIAFVPAFHRFLHQLERAGYGVHRQRLAGVVGLAARVDEHDPRASFASQMGRPAEGRNQARVSDLRLRRLLAAQPEDASALYSQLRRIVQLLNGRVNLLSLADAAYSWSVRTRQDWAYDYYQAAPSRT
jgi:CRISPR system Cascade subunit CasB